MGAAGRLRGVCAFTCNSFAVGLDGSLAGVPTLSSLQTPGLCRSLGVARGLQEQLSGSCEVLLELCLESHWSQGSAQGRVDVCLIEIKEVIVFSLFVPSC